VGVLLSRKEVLAESSSAEPHLKRGACGLACKSMRRACGLSIVVCGLLLASVALAACGSDSGTEQRIARERRDAAHQARQEERLKQLERQLKEQKSSRAGSGGSGSAPAQSSLPGRSCGGSGLSANQNTSCPFAEEVRAAYQRGGGSSSVEAFSPVTGQTYTMNCSTGSPHVCTGANNATVYFP
jgi:hypothetical protein